MVYIQLLWVESCDKIYLDGGATEADGRASAPVSHSVATPLLVREHVTTVCSQLHDKHIHCTYTHT